MSSIYWTGATDTDWNNTGNWSGAAVPITGDDVYFGSNTVNVTLNLNQSAVTLASLTIDQSYTGTFAAQGTYLQVNATTLTIGRAGAVSFAGSGRLNIKGTITTATIFNSAQSGKDTGYPPISLLGTITSLNVLGGSVGVAVQVPFETATVTTLNVTNATNTAPTITLGTGTTVTTLNMDAGNVNSSTTATVTTATLSGGTYSHSGSSAHTTLNVQGGGKALYNCTGTITNLNIYAGTFDTSSDPRSKTVTNCNVYGQANLNVSTGRKGSVTFTNGIQINGVDLQGLTLQLGPGRNLALT